MPLPMGGQHGPAGDVRFVADLEVGVDLPLGRLGSRALAQMIDLAILTFASLILFLLALGLGGFTGSMTVAMVAMIVVQFVLFWGYYFLWELLWSGQTPGKRAIGLRVVHADGTNIGLTASLVRNLLRPIDFRPADYGVGLLVLVITPRSQRLGDLAAGTVVVRELHGAEAGAHLDLRWPAGIRPGDAELIESFFEQAPTLLPQRRGY